MTTRGDLIEGLDRLAGAFEEEKRSEADIELLDATITALRGDGSPETRTGELVETRKIMNTNADIALRYYEALEMAADTFRDTERALRLLGHPVAAEAMKVAEKATRTTLERSDHAEKK